MTFIDTNVLVYSVDGKEPQKQSIAIEIVSRAIDHGGFLLSAQVLNEFSNIALLKLKMTIPEVRDFVSMFAKIGTVPVESGWTDRALEIRQRYGIQFFDALLLVAAEAHGCDTIYTEDLAAGQTYCGVRAENPFGAL